MRLSSALRRVDGARPRAPGWWIPWLFAGGLGLVVLVNGALVYFAVETFSGLTSDHAYESGLAYDQTLTAERQAAALGWTMDLAIGATGELAVRFVGRDGRALDGLSVSATFVRPTLAGYDFTRTLAGLGEGRYGATVEAPLPGVWDIRLLAVKGASVWQTVRRVELR
jgi:nitrogen fixation protein FixH